jgi:sulfite reductase (NADPH) flavoprotein alpha-component
MNALAPQLPANAPFTPAQQAWINGYLAALLSGDSAAARPSIVVATAGGIAALQAPGTDVSASAPAQSPAEEDFPWHDPSLSLDARMEMAAGKSYERRLMAAMAQQDCGQCGYLCQSYAEAIASGAEKSFAKCVPGGKETSRKLKELAADGAAVASVVVATKAPVAAAAAPAESAPVPATFVQAAPLNRPGSAKDTRHVVFRAADAPVEYRVGDALGVHVANDPALADGIVERLGIAPESEVEGPDGVRRSLRDALIEGCDIGRPTDQAIEVLASRALDRDESERLQALAEGYPGAGPEDADLLDLLLAFPSARPPVQELISALGTLQPRLYSIASSPKARPGEVHLAVAAVRYQRRGRVRHGIASIHLAERAKPGATLPVFVKPAHAFGLPQAPETPILMIGPGTGIAPFRAFLEERRATGAKGRNWLFFGDQCRATDYLFEAELEDFRRDGLLSRLDLAFSRDQAEKLYVQHRMREQARDIWAWVQEGAHIYVCGDAIRMAKDVDTALGHIFAKQGAMTLSGAKSLLADLARQGRYQRDVY